MLRVNLYLRYQLFLGFKLENMAEIKIEKKTTLFPWLLGALLLAGLIYFIVVLVQSPQSSTELSKIESISQAPPLVQDLTQPNAIREEVITGDLETSNNVVKSKVPLQGDQMDELPDEAVASYVAFLRNNKKMDIHHEYSNAALLSLIKAVQQTAVDHDIEITADLNEAKESAAYITKDPYKLNHADHIKKASSLIMTAIKNIQKQSFPDMKEEIASLQNDVNAIETEMQTLEQKDKIRHFFNQAAVVLTKMEL